MNIKTVEGSLGKMKSIAVAEPAAAPVAPTPAVEQVNSALKDMKTSQSQDISAVSSFLQGQNAAAKATPPTQSMLVSTPP